MLYLSDFPTAVNVKAVSKDNEITLTWEEPEDNGAAITQYSVYQGLVDDKQWGKLASITDTKKREYVIKVEKEKTGKEYKFTVTATNKYGESPKANIAKVEVLGGKFNFASGGDLAVPSCQHYRC